MKKALSLFLALILLLSLAGCRNTDTLSAPGSTVATTTEAAQTDALQTDATSPTPYIEFVTFPTEETEPQETDPVDPRPHPTDPIDPRPHPTEPEETWPDDNRPRPTEPEQTQPEEQPTQPEETQPKPTEPQGPWLDPYGTYTRRDDVALYIHLYGRLPNNFITKSQAKALGWKSGSLERYAPGKCIGGDRFYNNEGLLPKASGRYYYECDIDTLGASNRGAKRIVYSNDGLIYYTSNHYASFTLLYGAP